MKYDSPSFGTVFVTHQSSINTTVQRKPMHIEQYINRDFSRPEHVKRKELSIVCIQRQLRNVPKTHSEITD